MNARNSCNVPTRVRRAADQPLTDRVPRQYHHRCALAGPRLGGDNVSREYARRCVDNVEIERHQLLGQLRPRIQVSTGHTSLDSHRLTLPIAVYCKLLYEGAFVVLDISRG